MKFLIDTHIFLWFINNDPQLSPTAKTLLESDVELLLSVASLWEITIKISTGKMTLPCDRKSLEERKSFRFRVTTVPPLARTIF